MTRQEAIGELSRLAIDGGIYRQKYIFVFDDEMFKKVMRILQIADNYNCPIWKDNLDSFTTDGITLSGSVSGQFERYCVIACKYLEDSSFLPGYTKSVLDTLTHEVIHAAQFTFMTNGNHEPLSDLEPMAYLCGWLLGRGIEQLATQGKTFTVFSPISDPPSNNLWNMLFRKIYTFNSQSLMQRMLAMSDPAIDSAIRMQANNQINQTVFVNDQGWRSTTFLEGVSNK